MSRRNGYRSHRILISGYGATLRRLEEYNDSDLLDSESDSDDTIVRTNNMATITSYHINDEDTNHDRDTRVVVVATTNYG